MSLCIYCNRQKNSVFKIDFSHDSSRDIKKRLNLPIVFSVHTVHQEQMWICERVAQSNLLLTYLPYVFIYLESLLKNRFFS